MTTFDSYSHGMDESDRLNAITICSSQSLLNTKSHDLSQDFAKCFSIDDDDDDDIVFLDENDLINDEVKIVLNSLLTKLTDDIIHQSQIDNLSINNKRSFNDINNPDEYTINSKKVRFTITSNENSLTNIFISEQLQTKSIQTQTHNQFLFNLGFDLCLEQNLDNHTNLSIQTKQNLINFNKIFHQYEIYSCKYCSFQTNTIHVIENHYQTLHMDKNEKYFCTKCLFRTYHLPILRRHFQQKHHLDLITDQSINRRYQCCFCSFETNHKTDLFKHNRHCQIVQQRTMHANNLLKPDDDNNNNNEQIKIHKEKTNTTTRSNDSIETLIIESDHEISSEEEFIVSSDDNDDDENSSNPTTTTTTIPIIQQNSSFSSLSKLLFLNNTPISTTKPALVPIQPRPINGNDIYQICHLCQLYISKNELTQHMTDKHKKPAVSTPIVILNNPITTYLQPTLIIPPPPTTIFLLSTSTMNKQSISLNMIKCPWCDTNFEHIDIMTGHLMKYHRMTLAAAKVVVAEQMKIQSSSSNQLSILFKQEIELIKKEFSEKTYWHISKPKVYLHQIESLSCFVCQLSIDNLENHLLSTHQVDLLTLNQIKQCGLCGQTNHSSLFEHQLRSHQGVCYSTVLKQFIRFQPPPLPVPFVPKKPINRTIISPSFSRRLTTLTEKKFACRKCPSSDDLLTFDELVEHLRSFHKIHVKLNRRCVFCQQTFIKGKEYNQHCLQHLNDQYPSIKLQRQYVKSRK